MLIGIAKKKKKKKEKKENGQQTLRMETVRMENN
jgi:hypothetical protein